VPSAPPRPASLSFRWPSGATPVVSRTTTGIDDLYINPGAVIVDGDTLHMFANVFTAWPGQMDVAHLRSTDGVSWTPASEGPVLTSDDVPFADPGMDVSTGYVTHDGTWVLVIESVSAERPWVLGRATAPGPDGPWTVDPEPILEPGPADAIDTGGLAWPSVVATPDGFAMYYTAMTHPRGNGVIALATSKDGVDWTKRAEPVLTPGATWEFGKVDRPRVVSTPNGYLMVYSGSRLTDRGLAWSADGFTWRRDGDAPAIARRDFPIRASAWDAALIARDGSIEYFVELGTGPAGTNIYRAVATLP
jgi:predicted GH43/DUF377 family glycosyl hydrolase